MSARDARNIDDFFNGLAATVHAPLHDVRGTVRFDLDEDGAVEHWLLRIDDGHVDVSRRNTRADAVVGTDQALFGRLTAGEANMLTAGLRGQLRVEGETALVVAFDRLMPSPPGRHTILPPVGRRARAAAQATKESGTATRTARTSSSVAGMTRKDRAR